MFYTVKYRYSRQVPIRALLIALLLFCGIAGLWALPVQEEAGPREPLVITDMRGRSVSLPADINGIVALGAGSLRLVTYLEAADAIIAVEDSGHGREKTVNDFFPLATYRLAYPGLRDLPDIGSSGNHEGIIAAAPDIVISSTVDVGQLDHLQAVLGVPVFAINADVEFDDRELFNRQLRVLGKVLDRERRAEELIAGINGILEDIKTRSELVEKPKRAYAGGMMFYGPADLLRTTGDFLPFDLTGAGNVMPTNPAKNLQPYMTSLEDLIAADPDYVFVDAANVNLSRAGFTSNRKVLEEQVAAFQNREVYTTLVYKYYGTNWENQLINVYYVGKVLYPELYDDISIEEKAEEIWSLFFGLPLEYSTVVKLQKTGPGRVDWF